ncbi:hypothetical protein QBC33DRAFT_556723 [Phialemonium atrogriseum]|uniref:Calcium channel subunit cch1 n=1 Tax=Phialemonium atrogriseum TaxID=1093897 RepID=A0AAJ0C3U3_9PEZI|nr:uncharacterized protein QBC33DRAFT_556723 [Phialemonium atrogriseum]KAK1769426.1 hypothetical protein QBC33DRAFT_556723 [Phialemonium atrogriseum]
MQTPRFQAIANRFSAHRLRTSFRRSSSASSSSTSSRASSTDRSSYCSRAPSPVGTINSVIFRQPSIVDLEEERRSFGSELAILEPRPIVYWGSFQDRMGSF